MKTRALFVWLRCFRQRPGEVANMRREHIVDGWWQMPGEPIPGVWPGTKNAASHRVWLSKPVQDLLATMGNGAPGFVFTSPRGGPISKLDDAMRSICATLTNPNPVDPNPSRDALGVDRATPHDLRRTHGSTVTALGFGRDAMNRIQNPREGSIADVYDRHRYEAETKRIMEAVAAKIMAQVEGGAADNVVTMKRPARKTRTK
jgi:integrase